MFTNRPHPIANYNATARDTAGLDYHETILGHLVLEQRLSFDDALYYLDSMARSELRDWKQAESNAQIGLWVCFGSGAITFLSAFSGPVGLVLGLTIGGIGCGFSWFIKDRAQHVTPFRECEANLIGHHSWVRDEMKRLNDSGVSVTDLVSRYDLMLKQFFAAGGVTTDANQIMALIQPVAPEPIQAPAPKTVSALVQKRLEREQRNILGNIPIDDSSITIPVAMAPTSPPPAAAGLPQFIAEMTYPVRSGMIVGLPGAGKDLVMANVLGRIADRNPDMQIFVTDPKNSPKESGYFQRFAAANVDRFKAKAMSAFEIQERMEAMYSKVVNAGEKTLWAINEFATLVGLVDEKWLKGFNAKLQTIVQMGDSEENYLWIVSQTGNLSELKLPSSLRGTLARNFLAIAQPGYEAALAGLTRTDLITNHDDARMRAMWERSPVKRAYFYSTLNRWESMPVLPNLSGYDRDKRQWIDGATPPEPVTEPTAFDVTAVDRMLGQKPKSVPVSGQNSGGEPWSSPEKPRKPIPKPITKQKTEVPALETDPVMEAIEQLPNGDRKTDLIRAYKWHQNRTRKGKTASFEDFKKAVNRKGSDVAVRSDPTSIYRELTRLFS